MNPEQYDLIHETIVNLSGYGLGMENSNINYLRLYHEKEQIAKQLAITRFGEYLLVKFHGLEQGNEK